jgi:hypothetical protein
MMSTARDGSWLSTRRLGRRVLWLESHKPCLAWSTMAMVRRPARRASWRLRFAEVEEAVAVRTGT